MRLRPSPSVREASPRRPLRTTLVCAVLIAAGSVLGPPVASAAQSVFVNNTESNPVPTKAVGTTAVGGTVALAEGTSVQLADGTTVALQPGATVSLADNTVRLADGTALRLADGSTVALATGSVVGLADGTKVTLASPVQLAEGTVVALASGSAVTIANDDASAVPVRVVGGASDGSSASEPASFSATVFLEVNEDKDFGDVYTVPEGKRLVITSMSGYADRGVGRVSIERRNCDGSGSGRYIYGIISGEADTKVWSFDGEFISGPGCQLVPYVTRSGLTGLDSASFHLFGYLLPA
jgi:hypothetical protein